MKLSDALKEDNILLDVETEDWQEAIRKAGELMVKLDLIVPSYTEGMIEVMKTLGPYAVIAPGVALPHAQPDKGSLKVGLVFLKLKTPVNFGSPNDPVNLILAFAAIDNKGHVELIKELALFLSQKGVLENLRKAGSKEEIMALLEKYCQ